VQALELVAYRTVTGKHLSDQRLSRQQTVERPYPHPEPLGRRAFAQLTRLDLVAHVGQVARHMGPIGSSRPPDFRALPSGVGHPLFDPLGDELMLKFRHRGQDVQNMPSSGAQSVDLLREALDGSPPRAPATPRAF
jgi:hypothetical protein